MKPNIGLQQSGLEIGKWTFYAEFGRFVNRQGDEFFIDNRLTRLLQFLLERKDLIVRRNEIIEHVWKEVYVSEDSLTKGIFDLRKSLKEKDITEIEISTIRNKGYRLIINGDTPKTKIKPTYKLFLNILVYFLVISSFLILLVRAIRYTN